MNKTQREWFGELDREGIVGKLDELLDYCAADVDVTHQVYKKVFPHFLETCPNTVSSAALRHLASEILPVNKDWEANIANAEATYNKLSDGVRERLVDLTEQALEHRNEPNMYNHDPWLRQLDWSGQEVRMTKGKFDNVVKPFKGSPSSESKLKQNSTPLDDYPARPTPKRTPRSRTLTPVRKGPQRAHRPHSHAPLFADSSLHWDDKGNRRFGAPLSGVLQAGCNTAVD
ncbi:hypothetical protein B0A48_18818, partial [Cryoendolithus antarcticus]